MSPSSPPPCRARAVMSQRTQYSSAIACSSERLTTALDIGVATEQAMDKNYSHLS